MIWDGLRHPLLLLAAGGLLSTLFSWQWQNRQKRNEVRLSLVGDMSAAVMEFVALAKQAYRHRVDPSSLETDPAKVVDADSVSDLADSARNFDVKRCVIGTKLEAYLSPSSKVPQLWDRFGDSLLILGGAIDPDDWSRCEPQRKAALDRLELSEAEWQFAVTRARNEAQRPDYVVGTELDWFDVLALLLHVKIRLIRLTMTERMPVFELRTTLWKPKTVIRLYALVRGRRGRIDATG
jgi:hypothetical protein